MTMRGGGGAGRFPSGMKHSSFIESQKKLKLSSDSEGTYEKAMGKVWPEFNTPTAVNKGKRSLFVLNVPSITNDQSETKRWAALSCSLCANQICFNLRLRRVSSSSSST